MFKFASLFFLIFCLSACVDKPSETTQVKSAEAKESIKKKTNTSTTKTPNDKVTPVSVKKKEVVKPISEEKQKEVKKVEPKKVAKKSPKKKESPKPKKVTPKASPLIEFEELVFDFGEITEGDKISHKFKFTNTGNAPLTIEKANATCGCTQPSFPFIDINPGEQGYIGVDYYSVNKDGAQSPEITVFGNVPEKTIVLTLKGFVKPKEKPDTTLTTQLDSLPFKKKS